METATILGLWLPILLSAVGVFVVSSIIHMALPWHKSDFSRLQGEDAVLEAMRRAGVEPGNYVFPYASSMSEMGTEEMKKKIDAGPVGFVNVKPNMAMGPSLAAWFAFTVVIGIFTAYVATRTVAAGADYLHVFRVVGAVAFLGYSGSVVQDSIWKGVKWSSSLKTAVDGLVYALVTAGCFGWLWPR